MHENGCKTERNPIGRTVSQWKLSQCRVQQGNAFALVSVKVLENHIKRLDENFKVYKKSASNFDKGWDSSAHFPSISFDPKTGNYSKCLYFRLVCLITCRLVHVDASQVSAS